VSSIIYIHNLDSLQVVRPFSFPSCSQRQIKGSRVVKVGSLLRASKNSQEKEICIQLLWPIERHRCRCLTCLVGGALANAANSSDLANRSLAMGKYYSTGSQSPHPTPFPFLHYGEKNRAGLSKRISTKQLNSFRKSIRTSTACSLQDPRIDSRPTR
jgi:hypothetical protein